jgi:hypothetical protein
MIEKIPEEFIKLINFLDEIATYEDVAIRSLDEDIELVKVESIIRQAPQVIWFRHGFGFIRIFDDIYIVETNIFINDLFKAPQGTVISLSRLCLKSLYDAYRFYYKIERFKRRLIDNDYDRKYVSNIHSDLKYVLRKTKIPKGVLCEETNHV